VTAAAATQLTGCVPHGEQAELEVLVAEEAVLVAVVVAEAVSVAGVDGRTRDPLSRWVDSLLLPTAHDEE
jgi:hypothetical protein